MIAKDSFLFWGQRVTLSYNLCPLGIEATSWTLAKGYRGAKGQFFPRPVSYPLWQPLSPGEMRLFLEFSPKASVVQKDNYS